MNQDDNSIVSWIKKVRRRIIFRSWQEHLASFSAISALIFAGAVLLSKFVDLPFDLIRCGALCLLMAVLSSVAVTVIKRASLLQAAVHADAMLRLKDRISSAYSVIVSPPADSRTAPALIRDAAGRLAQVRSDTVVPYRFPRASKSLGAALLAVSLLWLLPNYPRRSQSIDIDNVENIKKAGSQLVKETKDALSKTDLKNPDTLALAKELNDLGRRIEKDLDRKEALKELNRLEEKINQKRDQAAPAGLKKNLQALNKELNALKEKPRGPASHDKVSERVKALTEQLKQGKLNAEDAKQLKKALGQIAENLRGSKDTDELSKALEEALQSEELTGEALSQIAKQLEKLEAMDRQADVLQALEAQCKASKQSLCQLGKKGQGALAEKKNGSEAGKGSTNQAAEPFKTEPLGALNRQNEQRKPSKTGTYERLYDAERLDQYGYDSKLKGKLTGKGKTSFLYLQSSPGADPVLTPYADLYPKYAQSAEDPVAKSKVPPNYRKYVKDYFEAINPEKQK
jgi:hypothetical protein